MPQPPQIRKGFFNVYIEKIDTFLMALAITPSCYMCEKKFKLGDRAIVIRIRGTPLRFDDECYNQLVVGIAIFNDNYENMEVFSSGLQ